MRWGEKKYGIKRLLKTEIDLNYLESCVARLGLSDQYHGIKDA
jgi:hypothetical protein